MRNNIKELREKKDMSQEELACCLGVKRAAVSKYENGLLSLTQPILISLCNIFDVSADYILGLSSAPEKMRIPVLGRVRGGAPSFASEDIIDFESVSGYYSSSIDSYFALEVIGESMSPMYLPGDRVIIKKQPVCENGCDAIVMVGEDDATIKRFYKRAGMIILQPLNPSYNQMVFGQEEVEELPVRVIGIVVELRRKVA